MLDDAIIKDSKLCVILVCVGIIFLSVCAAFALTNYPGEFLLQTSLEKIIPLVSGFSCFFILIFFCVNFTWLTIIIVISCASLLFPLFSTIKTHISYIDIAIISLSLPCFYALTHRLAGFKTNSSLYEIRLKWLTLLTFLMGLIPFSLLGFITSLHPYTFDAFALHADALTTYHFVPWLISWIGLIPNANLIFSTIYDLTPFAPLVVAIRQLKGRLHYVPSMVLVWVVLSFAAALAFNFFPITGPKYVYPNVSAYFHLQNYPIHLYSVPANAFRNGMPSMHFGWMFAACIIWFQSGTTRWSQIVFLVLTLMVGCSTLYLGEHYCIDLIIAMPFTLSILVICTHQVTLSFRKFSILLGLATYFCWIILIRTQIELLVLHTWWLVLLNIITTIVIVYQISVQFSLRNKLITQSQNQKIRIGIHPISNFYGLILLIFMGFFSGIFEMINIQAFSLTENNDGMWLVIPIVCIGFILGKFTSHLWLRKMLPSSIVVYCFLGLFIALMFDEFFWNKVPDYFSSFTGYAPVQTLKARNGIRGIVCAILMTPFAFFTGTLLGVIHTSLKINVMKLSGLWGFLIYGFLTLLGMGFQILSHLNSLIVIGLLGLSTFLLVVIIYFFKGIKNGKDAFKNYFRTFLYNKFRPTSS